MATPTFKELEHAGWAERADAYDGLFARVTAQAIGPILDSFGDLTGEQLLDVACGTGNLVAAARERGALAEGLDFAATMVARARAKYPQATFTEGDAESLPFEDESFDAVTCAFGLLHVPHAETAMAEARRVLRPGGRYSFTVWQAPERGGAFYELLFGAVEAHGTLDVPLPPAPPVFRFADPEQCRTALAAVGFGDPQVSVLPLIWRGRESADILDLIYRSLVRMPMMLEAQAPAARDRIHDAIITGAERYRSAAGVEIPIPAVLVSAGKRMAHAPPDIGAEGDDA